MYRLTERRFEAALSIFEKYQTHIDAGYHINSLAFERELRDCWNVGYRELKDILIQLLSNPRYELLAASYMETSNGGQIVTEFQESLERLYGSQQCHGSDWTQKRDDFWNKAFNSRKKPR